jgi:hypothetical protein
MISTETFYSSYLEDYNGYKLLMLTSILKNLERFENDYFSEVDGYKRDHFSLVLKTEIHQSYFHSIETLFELIFALLPENEVITDHQIQYRLANSNWKKNYNTIRKISQDRNELNFLDEKISLSDNIHISKGHYIFYFGLYGNSKIQPELLNEIPLSLENIKSGLFVLAKDFTNRDIYNSYKHGLRLIPALKNIYLLERKTMQEVVKFDLSNSITFMTVNEKEKSIKYTTKNFDIWRDIELSKFAIGLISNIINLRRASLNLGEEQFPINTYPTDNFEVVDKGTNDLKEFSYVIKRNTK